MNRDKKAQILIIKKQIEDELKNLEQKREAIDIAVQKRISEIQDSANHKKYSSSYRRSASVSHNDQSNSTIDSKSTVRRSSRPKSSVNSKEVEDIKKIPPSKKRPLSVKDYRPKVTQIQDS